MTPLLNCPFCNSMSVFMRSPAQPVDKRIAEDDARYVECAYCDARGPKTRGQNSEERAVMLWNVAKEKQKP
jgi:restriction alleviation protein Lar